MSVLLYSSGLDSELYRLLLEPDKLLFFRAGASYQDQEEHQMNKMKRSGMIPSNQQLIIEDSFDFSPFEDENMVVPMRNVFYMLRAFEHSEDVMIGVSAYDLHYDKQQNTLHSLEGFIRNYYYGREVPETWETIHPQIHTPFHAMTKGEILEMAINEGCDVGHIPNLRTCYDKDSEIGCGKCPSCIQKAIALAVNDLFKPELFDNDPRNGLKTWMDVYLHLSKDTVDEALFRKEVECLLGK